MESRVSARRAGVNMANDRNEYGYSQMLLREGSRPTEKARLQNGLSRRTPFFPVSKDVPR
jgi:hypothetical protein